MDTYDNVNMALSPAMSTRSDFSDMDDEALELYLATCVPLSNLPTPPPAKQQLPLPPRPTSPPSVADRPQHSPKLQVYAIHLANLVPRNVSSLAADTSAIQVCLERAGLPAEIVAFAGCILDALSSRFGGAWRQAFGASGQLSCDAPVGYDMCQRSVSPDLVVLAALALAHDFIDDRSWTNSHWAKVEGSGRFEAADVERTKMCILQDMDYALFRINQDMVLRGLRDLQRAYDVACPVGSWARKTSIASGCEEQKPRLSVSTGSLGVAVWVHGVQTPEPSP